MRLLDVWQLFIFIAYVAASKTALHARGGDVAGEAATLLLLANRHTVEELHTRLFQPLDQCPRPGPCHHSSAESEFCVFASNARDDKGRSQIVPMVTTQNRALKLTQLLSRADDDLSNRWAGRGRPDRSSTCTQPKKKYTVSPIPGKGLGIILTTALARGDHILSDLPTLIVDHCMMATVPQYHLARLMNEAAKRLSASQLDRLMKLDVFGEQAPDEHYLVGRIYATSAYMLDPDGVLFGDECGIGALFPESQ